MLLVDLFFVGMGAVVGGWLCRRAGVPEVLGYLAAGVLLGPSLHANSFVDAPTIRAIGQFAIVFRMFTLGLDFDARRLRGRWRPALSAGGLEMGVSTLAGVALAFVLGWPLLEGAVLGAALGTTSTSILSKALADRNMTTREDARAAGAATLTEDLIAMGLLALLTVFGGTSDPSMIWENALGILVYASLAFTAGAILVPLGLDRLGRSRSDELLTLAVIGILFGFAGLSVALGAGPAVGAFLAGIAVGAARTAPGVQARVMPLRDLLAAVAYVAIGLILDFRTIVSVAPWAMLVAVVFVALKVLTVTIGLRAGGVPTVTAARAGAILGQAGTMGLVFACGPFLDPARFPMLMAFAFCAWAFTVGLTPLRLRYLPDVAERVARALGAGERLARSTRLPRGARADVRDDVMLGVLAVGCGVAAAALAGLVARADVSMLPAFASPAVTLVAGAVAGLVAVPFAVVAAGAARRLLHQRIQRAVLHPSRLTTGDVDPSRAWSSLATMGGLGVALLLPTSMGYALAPPAARVWLLAGALVTAAFLLARQRLLLRLADDGERLARARGEEAQGDARLHDFRGVSPFGYDVEALLVRPGTRAAWAAVKDIALPERTGARIVAVVRPGSKDGTEVGPDTVLHPGDEVVVGGTPANVIAARRYLLDPASGEPGPPGPTHVPPPPRRGTRQA